MPQASIADLLARSREAGVTVRVLRDRLIVRRPPSAKRIVDQLLERRNELVRYMLRTRLLPAWPEPGAGICSVCGLDGRLRRDPSGWLCSACRALHPVHAYRRAWPELMSHADTRETWLAMTSAVDTRARITTPEPPCDPCHRCGALGWHPPCRPAPPWAVWGQRGNP